jgi:hypothetical protein
MSQIANPTNSIIILVLLGLLVQGHTTVGRDAD